ncbi:recombinase family protein [Pseudomonas fragi]|uniref:Recombinase n=1 Tax=Pseudomonas fragi TaxID=296 RepID=A0A449IRL7_PSEFR|nr:recombinase family protein [Pseudomonas fragi]VFB22084.1 recombinase [Pseudomonas fragi]
MPSAISYIRFSSSKQSDGNSHQRQMEAAQRWLINNPSYTASTMNFEDLGVSGFHGDHIKDGGGWAKLLLAVEAGHIKAGDVVLVEAMDRTGRLPALQMIEIIRPVLQAGIAIITLDDNNKFDEDSLNGPQIFLLVAKIQAAHGYSKILSERTKESYQIRKEKARKGEKVRRGVPIWLTTDGELKAHLAPYIKEVFDLYISGVGKNTIANRLRASGVPEFKTCSGPTVGSWLQNTTTIGYWDDIPDVYPAVVSKELFLQAQNRWKEVAKSPPSRTSKNFLVGLVKCGICDGNLIFHNKDGKPHSMRCLTNHRLRSNGCSNNKSIPHSVIWYIYTLTASQNFRRALEKIELTATDKRKLTVTAELEKVQAKIVRAVNALISLPDMPEIVSSLKELNAQRDTLQVELQILDRTVDEPGKSSIHFNESLVEDDLLINDPIRLNSLLKGVDYTITTYTDGLIIVAGESYPWLYTGVKRTGNRTLGYKVQYLAMEDVISPEVSFPSCGTQTENESEQMRYVLRRSHKLISVGMPVDAVYLD